MRSLLIGLALAAAVIFTVGTLFERRIILAQDQLSAGKVNRLVHSADPAEVPVFGSSRAEGSFLPEVICPGCFNYGLSGTGNYVLVTFLEIELKKPRKTPVILNIDPWSFGRSLGSPGNYLINADQPEIRELLGDDYRWYYRIPVLKYYGHWEDFFFQHTQLKYDYRRIRYLDRGALLEFKRIPTREALLEQLRAVGAPTPLDLSAPAARKLIKLCRGARRPIVVVLAPIYDGGAYLHPAWRKNWDQLRAELAVNPQVVVLDYSAALTDENYFYNATHLSLAGAQKFSQMLRDELAKRALIK